MTEATQDAEDPDTIVYNGFTYWFCPSGRVYRTPLEGQSKAVDYVPIAVREERQRRISQ